EPASPTWAPRWRTSSASRRLPTATASCARSPDMAAFLPQVLIRKKRDGGRLTEEEIRAFIAGAADGSLPDYQISAMLMAIFFRGLDSGAIGVWADAMVRSGDVIDLSSIDRPKVDKHSTGGVGDKISLALAP